MSTKLCIIFRVLKINLKNGLQFNELSLVITKYVINLKIKKMRWNKLTQKINLGNHSPRNFPKLIDIFYAFCVPIYAINLIILSLAVGKFQSR